MVLNTLESPYAVIVINRYDGMKSSEEKNIKEASFQTKPNKRLLLTFVGMMDNSVIVRIR